MFKSFLFRLFLLSVLVLFLSSCTITSAVTVGPVQISGSEIKGVLKGYPVIYNAEVNYYNQTGDISKIDELNSYFNLPCGSDTSMIQGQNYQTYDMAAISCVVLQEIYVNGLTRYLEKLQIAPTPDLINQSSKYLTQALSSIGIKEPSKISPQLRNLMIQWYADDTALNAHLALELQTYTASQLFNLFKNALTQTCFSYFQVPDQSSALLAQLKINSEKEFNQVAAKYGGATNLGCGSLLSTSNSQVNALAGFAFATPVGHTLEINAGQTFLVVLVKSRKPIKLTNSIRQYLVTQLLQGTQSPLLGSYARQVIQNALLHTHVVINSSYGNYIAVANAPYVCAPPVPNPRFYSSSASLRNTEDQKILGSVFNCGPYYN